MNGSEPSCGMLFPLEPQALLLEGRMRLQVTDEYCCTNRVLQLPQDQADDITAVGFRSHSPPFLYSYESEMHIFIKWIRGLLSKHKTFLCRALITNLQYFCHKLTWKTSLSEGLALDADSLWSVCVRRGMLWKEPRHAGLKTEASQGGRNNWNRTWTIYQRQQTLTLCSKHCCSFAVGTGVRRWCRDCGMSMTFKTCCGTIILCIWWERPCCSFSEMPPVANSSILVMVPIGVRKLLFSWNWMFWNILWLCTLTWLVMIEAVWSEHHLHHVLLLCSKLNLKFSLRYHSGFNLFQYFSAAYAHLFLNLYYNNRKV